MYTALQQRSISSFLLLSRKAQQEKTFPISFLRKMVLSPDTTHITNAWLTISFVRESSGLQASESRPKTGYSPWSATQWHLACGSTRHLTRAEDVDCKESRTEQSTSHSLPARFQVMQHTTTSSAKLNVKLSYD